MNFKRLFFVFLSNVVFFLTVEGQSVVYDFSEIIEWKLPVKVVLADSVKKRLNFDGSYYENGQLPHFIKTYPIHSSDVRLKAYLSDIKTVELTGEEKNILLKNVNISNADTSFKINVQKVISRKQPFARVDLVPVRWNNVNKVFEKLVSFKINISVKDLSYNQNSFKNTSVVDNSVLSSGDWYKIRIDKDGIYKITYDDLQQMGFDLSADPDNIAIFGNGGGILPEKNDVFRYDDLVENPIYIKGGNDGVFNEGDYILFYGKGPHIWKYRESLQDYVHVFNIYDDYAYYFITVLNKKGKRITVQQQPSQTEDFTVTDFIDRRFHELDEVNLAGMGRLWLGEYFDFDNVKTFNFSFPNLVKNKTVSFHGCFVTRSTTQSRFNVYADDVRISSVLIDKTPGGGYHFGVRKCSFTRFNSSNDDIKIKLEFKRFSSDAVGYLDYIELSAYRKLKITDDMMIIRNEFKNGSVAKYEMEGSGGYTIWDVSDPVNAELINPVFNNGKYVFKTTVSPVKKFAVFNGKEFLSAEFVSKIENQNLHAIKNIDYLIITPEVFLKQAEKLANFHRQFDNFKTEVVLLPEIYNEFSSGAQDITAIRDFVKHIYDASDPGKEIKYLLLFGDASYDYKDRIPGNTNFIPCWESFESLYIVNSVASDDYYGFLDDGEGGRNSNDKVDIGIGRLPVDNEEQAERSVEKIINYASNKEKTYGPWRNTLTFVADDGQGNLFVQHAEELSSFIEDKFPVYNIDKIYVDAFNQISTPSGQRAPGVNKAITNDIEKGTLILNYIGHGGELGFGDEQFLKLSDINSWTNFNKLSVFITATCEFSRFDDPKRVSAGEQVFLNPNGGGIALFSTSRATFANGNLSLNMAIYDNNIFTKENGEYPRFGDVIRKSKKIGGANDMKFVLLGDPVLKLAYTDYSTETMKINDHIVDVTPDTIKAFQHVKIEGEVVDGNDNIVSSFNGLIYPKVFDKKKKVVTLGDESQPFVYEFWNNILFNGKASVKKGKFQFEFVVPKDIGYEYGGGRISYYLHNDDNDGSGYFQNVVIGGYDENAVEDREGPEIKLYLNDSLFVSGDITDENPTLYAVIYDESGINTTGNGIGHDIVATIDDNPEYRYVVNDFYESYLDRFDMGTIIFPFKNIPEGNHRLTLKVWDVYNNSSTAGIDFTVVKSGNLTLENLFNFPNPFTNYTTFSFGHNQNGKNLKVTIDIYSLDGKKVKTISKDVIPYGYVNRDIRWNGRNDAGSLLPGGVYPYKVIIKDQNGKITGSTSKLVIVR